MHAETNLRLDGSKSTYAIHGFQNIQILAVCTISLVKVGFVPCFMQN
jgi:hypothetical protein